MTPDQYCERRAARSGSSFYYSFMFMPPERRRAIIALYAYCREVDDVVDEAHDPEVARAKLAWWRAEVRAVCDGTPQHPVARALQASAKPLGVRQQDLETVIDGMAMDLEQARYTDFDSLERYCHRVAGVVGVMSAQIMGYRDQATLDYARDLGVAFQLTNVIRDVGEDAGRGRIYLPQEDLARFGVDPPSILARQDSEAFRKLMAFEVDRAQRWYERALAKLPAVDRHSQRVGLAMAAIYRTTLREIERDGYRVLDRRISLTPLRKLWIAWRAVRRA
jgi:15-cis-phytoene synthase